MRSIDRIGLVAALLCAAFVADGSQTERGGGRTADTATEIVVPAQDAQPLPVAPPAEDDLNIGAPVDEPGPAGTPATAPVSDCQCADCNCEDCQCSDGECKCEGCEPPESAVLVSPGVSDVCLPLTVGNHNGTCVSIGNGVYLTAAHVLPTRATTATVTIDGESASARVQFATGQYHDFAIVTTTGLSHDGVPFSTDQPTFRQHVWFWSRQNGLEQLGEVFLNGEFSEGVATLGLLADDPGCSPGDSGSGVFNASGELIGIVSTRAGNNVSNEPRVVSFIPLYSVAAMLAPASAAESGEGYAVTTRDGVSYWNDATGRGWHDQGTGLHEGWTYGGRFTYRNGRMHDVDNAPQAAEPAESGYWKTVCHGNWCERVWVPYSR